MTAERQVVVGGTIAALVAADAIAAAGRPVALMLPGKGIGGGFASVRRDGRTLELGVRLLELGFEGATSAPPLSQYSGGVGGHRSWAPLVRCTIESLVGDRLREAGRPQMVLDGRAVDDVLFTVDLTALPDVLATDERAAMLAEVEEVLAREGDGAGLLAPAAAARLATMTLEQASRANHGDRFHERIVAPLCDKVLAGGAGAVAAPLRRKVWAPMFHPRTLREALAGDELSFRPSRPMHGVAPDGCGAIVDVLLDRLRAHELADVVAAGELTGAARADDGRVELGFADHAPVVARRPVLALSADSLFAATGVAYAPERVRTAIAWLEADAEAAAPIADVVHVLDRDNPVLRVSRGGGGSPEGSALLTVELRHDIDGDLAAEAERGLIAAGLLPEGTPTRSVVAMARPTFPVPSAATLAAYAAARARFDALELDVELAAGAFDVVADTLNDQIVQGLRAAERTS